MEIIAFYLPQFHPFKENDEWWGKGFTEWTNVGKAKPLFKGHNQPRVPTELGYYDLRLPIIREQQAQMAKDAGVTAFCYWHYWLGNGRRLIPEVFDEVLNTGKPDFPFCLGWANHSWFAKNWNADGSTTEKMLAEQTYPGIEDAKMHFDYLLKAFKDPRYLKIDGKPILYIFRPKELPQLYIDNFIKWSKESGFSGLMLVGELRGQEDRSKLITSGFDAVAYQRLTEIPADNQLFPGQIIIKKILRRLNRIIRNLPPRMEDYSKVYSRLLSPLEKENDVIPMLLPQWDHSPRSGRNGTIFINATPEAFFNHAKQALEMVKNKPNNRKLLFLKSWNEWGEGNMMEPDLTYGRGFINALQSAICNVFNS
jgi:hypothetical protein